MYIIRVSRKNIIYILVLLLCIQALFIGTPVYGWLQRTIHREFHWTYDRLEWSWSLDIPVDYYIAYAVIPLDERLHQGGRLYGKLVTTDDDYLRSIAEALEASARKYGYQYYETANFILAFVQSLPYIPDNISTPFDDFPKFPLETLIEGGGDCEDTSILYATLLKILGYDVILVSPPGHMMVGVAEYREKIPGWYVEFNNRKYYLAETTGEGWRVGDLPKEFQGVKVVMAAITGEQLRPQPIDVPNLIEEHKVLQQKYDELYHDYRELTQRYSELQQTYESLNNDYLNLKNKYDGLQVSFQQLKSEYEELQSDFEHIQTEYSLLQANYSSLQVDYNRLTKSFQEISVKYQSLKEEHKSLEEAHQKTLMELSSTQYLLGVYKIALYIALIIVVGLIILLIFKRPKQPPSPPH